MNTLHAVVMNCAELTRGLKGPALPQALSRLARMTLDASALLSKAPSPFPAPKDQEGRPEIFQGWHWSVSHKPGMVAGVVSTFPIGIDIEFYRPRCQRTYDYIMSLDRADLLMGQREPWEWFFRVWTAKEAVLKSTRLGLAGLSACKIRGFDSNGFLRVTMGEVDDASSSIPFSEWFLDHRRMGLHFGAVTVPDRCRVKWHAMAAPAFLDTPGRSNYNPSEIGV